MEKEFLIKLLSDKEGTFIKAFYSNNISELIKLYTFAKINQIPIKIPREDNFPCKYEGEEVFITDLSINFGGHESLTTLNIFVEV